MSHLMWNVQLKFVKLVFTLLAVRWILKYVYFYLLVRNKCTYYKSTPYLSTEGLGTHIDGIHLTN